MIKVSITEAKANFEWLVDQAERGVPVTITKWKKPVAELHRLSGIERQRLIAEQEAAEADRNGDAART